MKNPYCDDRPAKMLRAWRIAAGLTQAEVAARLNKSQQHYADLERGRSSPSYRTMHLIANKGFGVSVSQFLAGPGAIMPNTNGAKNVACREIPYFPSLRGLTGWSDAPDTFPLAANLADPARHAVVRVDNADGRPAVFEGDLLLVDCAKAKTCRSPKPGRLFIVSIDGDDSGFYLRRYRQQEGKRFWVVDSQLHSPLPEKAATPVAVPIALIRRF